MKPLVQQRDSEIEQSIHQEMASKEKVLVAELTQGDGFTKRARHMVVYAGLLFIFLNYIFLPRIYQLAGIQIQLQDFPTELWVGWSGIVATWSIGRTFEKRGASNPPTRAITGSRPASRIVDDDQTVV